MVANIQQSIFEELADFMVSQPTLGQIAAYHISEAAEQRIHELLEKNQQATLTPDEREEMTRFLAVSHLMTLAKAKARLRLEELK